MAAYILSIVLIFLNSIGLILFFVFSGIRISLWQIPLVVFSLIGLLIYPFVLFGKAYFGFYLVLGINLAALLWLLFARFQNKIPRPKKSASVKETIEFLAVYSFLFFFLGILAKTWFYTQHDEFSSWDFFVRSLIKYGARIPEGVHPAYIPGSSLIEFFFCTAGQFNEHIMLFCTAFLILCTLFFMASFLRTENHWHFLLCLSAGIALISLSGYQFNSIYVDCLTGCLFAALLTAQYFADKNQKESRFVFLTILSFSLLVKDVFFFFFLILFFIHLLNRDREIKIKVSAFVPLIFPLSWKIRNVVLKLPSGEDFSRVTFQNIIECFTPAISDYEVSVYDLIRKHLFLDPWGRSGLSIIQIVLVFLALAAVFSILTKQKSFMRTNIILFIGFVIYIILNEILYLFVLAEEIALQLGSYDRYIGIYLSAWGLFLTMSLITNAFHFPTDSDRIYPCRTCAFQILAVLSIAAIFLITPYDTLFAIPEKQNQDWRNAERFYQEYRERIPDESKTAVITTNDRMMQSFMILNQFSGEVPLQRIILNQQVDLDQLKAFMKEEEIEYAILCSRSDDFWKNWGSIFEGNPGDYDSGFLLYRCPKHDSCQLLSIN